MCPAVAWSLHRRWRPQESVICYGINPSMDVWLRFHDLGLERGYRQHAALESMNHDAARLLLMALTHTVWALYAHSYKRCTTICAATYGVLLFEYSCLKLLPSALYANWRWIVVLTCRLCLCTMSSRWSQQCLVAALGPISSYSQLARYVVMCGQALPEFIWQLVYSVPNSKVMLAMAFYTFLAHTLIAAPSMCISLLGEHSTYSIPKLQPLFELLGTPRPWATAAASTATESAASLQDTTAAAAAPGTCAAETFTGGLCLAELLEQHHGLACFKAASVAVAVLSVLLPLLVWYVLIERRQRLHYITHYVDWSGVHVLQLAPQQLKQMQQLSSEPGSPASSAASYCDCDSGSNTVAHPGQTHRSEAAHTSLGGLKHSSSVNSSCGSSTFEPCNSSSSSSGQCEIVTCGGCSTAGASSSQGSTGVAGAAQPGHVAAGVMELQTDSWVAVAEPADVAARLAVQKWMDLSQGVWYAWCFGIFAAQWLLLVGL